MIHRHWKTMNLQNIRIVLSRTSHPGNIGAAARAMKNMGLSDLALVCPTAFPNAEATARASGADDLLARASVFGSLDEAVADCSLVLGASARQRSLSWPTTDARAGAVRAVAESRRARVALVFGNEQAGLSNEELDRCQLLLNIPANVEYSSLNLAQAVQVVTYELMMAARIENDAGQISMREEALAESADLERFYAHLETVLLKIGFLDPRNPKYLMRRIRRLCARVMPTETEIQILRGILTKLEKHSIDSGGNRSK